MPVSQETSTEPGFASKVKARRKEKHKTEEKKRVKKLEEKRGEEEKERQTHINQGGEVGRESENVDGEEKGVGKDATTCPNNILVY